MLINYYALAGLTLLAVGIGTALLYKRLADWLVGKAMKLLCSIENKG